MGWRFGLLVLITLATVGCASTTSDTHLQTASSERPSSALLFDRYGYGAPAWTNQRADWPSAPGYWNRSEVVYYSQWTVDRAAYIPGEPNGTRQTNYISRYGRAFR